MERKELPNALGNRVFQQLMELYITPEVKRRQEAGILPKPLDLHAAQIIFFSGSRARIIRINGEVRAISKVKFKSGITKKLGDTIYENEIVGLDEIKLTDKEDPDCGHATLIKIMGRWIIAFDFRYNKGLSSRHLKTASEFFEAAEYSLSKKNWSAFLDSLFNCAELAAKVILFTTFKPDLAKRATHKGIQLNYNQFADLGNVKEGHRTVLNKLSGLRDDARYLKGSISMSEEEANSLLTTVKDMLEYSKNFSGVTN